MYNSDNSDEQTTWRNLIFQIYDYVSAAEKEQLKSAVLTLEQQLFVAVGNGDLEKVKDLLENQHAVINYRVIDPLINGGDRHVSVLRIALEKQQWDVARYLVEKGAKVNTYRDMFYRGAPLHIVLEYFATNKHKIADADQKALEWTKFLVEHGADLSAMDASGNSALHFAVRSNNKFLFDYCLEQGVNIELDAASIDIAKAKQQGLTSYGYRSAHTPLDVAAQNDRFEMAEELLKRGANVHGSPHHSSPLMIVSSHTSDDAHRMLKLFVAHGANIHAHYFHGETPLHMAFKYGSGTNAGYLLEKGADLYALNDAKRTPLNVYNDQTWIGQDESHKDFPSPELKVFMDKYLAQQAQQEVVETPALNR
jgi:ankyrin repeat protein